jgi:hypothetical protein
VDFFPEKIGGKKWLFAYDLVIGDQFLFILPDAISYALEFEYLSL